MHIPIARATAARYGQHASHAPRPPRPLPTQRPVRGAALLARAVENLLHNAACHNPGPVQVQLSAVRTGKTLRITIADDGAGYPPAVLHALQAGGAGENTPHILGLHVGER